MNVHQSLRFWLAPAVIGLAAGLLIVWNLPDAKPKVQLVPEPPPTREALEQTIPSYADAIERARASVVSIYTNSTVTEPLNPLFDDPFFSQFMPQRQRQQTSLGSGVVLDRDGHILTNAHVIRDAERIVVVNSQDEERAARLIGEDPDSDLAVLHVDGGTLRPIPIDTGYRARVGDLVFAVGNPFGVGQTVSMGIVSATGRHQPGLTRFSDFIQTDAAINPGNSGGALINAHGDLVGINTAIFSNTGGYQGIGFAIPYAHALDIADQIIEQGQVMRGYLGIDVRTLSPRELNQLGLRTRAFEVVDVIEDSPAAQAGLQAGDLLLGIEGEPLSSREAAISIIANHKPGDTLTLALARNRRMFEADVTLGKRPE
ncbi:S1C family serine protease [Saccharospirillum salsuginis]|uniref:S1C family serine protease n=1 Tax=Saccharospirillum salsuginis TaxID=418750 RepID=UPI0016759772|nr:trypsin-like peptidase domain-containing protein [Saccharospirillum salsuginis]